MACAYIRWIAVLNLRRFKRRQPESTVFLQIAAVHQFHSLAAGSAMDSDSPKWSAPKGTILPSFKGNASSVRRPKYILADKGSMRVSPARCFRDCGPGTTGLSGIKFRGWLIVSYVISVNWHFNGCLILYGKLGPTVSLAAGYMPSDLSRRKTKVNSLLKQNPTLNPYRHEQHPQNHPRARPRICRWVWSQTHADCK